MALSSIEGIKKVVADWLMFEEERNHLPLSDFDRLQYEIRPCDVLLIEGRSRVSEVIKLVTHSPWSHAALYLGRLHDIENPEHRDFIQRTYQPEPDQQLIIESMLGKGTIVTPLSEYSGDHIRICRPSGIARQDAQRVISYGIQKLGTDYDVRHILDLLRFLFPWGIVPRRWRSSLFEHNPGEATQQICSSMLAEAFFSVKFPVLPIVKSDDKKGVQFYQRNPRLYTPSDFDYSPYFEIIKYPYCELADTTIYRELPWNEQGIIGNNANELIIPEPNVMTKDADNNDKPLTNQPPLNP